jgi:hypothetical protein
MAAATTERKINHPKPRLAAVTEERDPPNNLALAITSYSFGVPERAGYSLGLGIVHPHLPIRMLELLAGHR